MACVCVNIHRVEDNCERCVVTWEYGNLNVMLDTLYIFLLLARFIFILYEIVMTNTNDMQISCVKYNSCMIRI